MSLCSAASTTRVFSAEILQGVMEIPAQVKLMIFRSIEITEPASCVLGLHILLLCSGRMFAFSLLV